MTKIHIDSKLN